MEISDIFDIGSLELVDRLIIVSYGKYIGTSAIDREYRVHESHLCLIGILELIDEYELVLFGEVRLDLKISLEELDSTEYHIREVDESL